MEIADWVYVMRHGKMIGCVAKKDTSPEELTRMMVDHALEKFEKAACHPGEVALSLSGLSYTKQDHAPVLRDVNLEIREGESYGLAGIEGNGQQELVEVLSGIESRWTGTYRLLGQNVAGKSVRASLIWALAASIPTGMIEVCSWISPQQKTFFWDTSISAPSKHRWD